MNAHRQAAVSILLVEDSEDDAVLLRRSLRESPFDIKVVETLSTAASSLKQKTSFDAVLLDLSLPDGHGFDSFSRIETLAPASAVTVRRRASGLA